ncbi:MAG: hypothetical protein EA412_03630 [Chitinophagaceae bacterium]|nr:MAG: hypothetical protein EA412_03630 [Chitinophagaceae bacterium]
MIFKITIRIGLILMLLSVSPIIIFDLKGQNCRTINNTVITTNYLYTSNSEGIKMPFNDSWIILLENQNAVIVALAERNGKASAGIVKNRNGFFVRNAHQIAENMIYDLIRMAGIEMDKNTIRNLRIKNIPVKEIEFEYTLYNLNEKYLMAGLIYVVVKGNYSYLFIFSSEVEDKICFYPFFREVMKNTFYDPQWYRG